MSLPQLIRIKNYFIEAAENSPLKYRKFLPAVLAHLIIETVFKTHDKIIRIYTNSFTKGRVKSLAFVSITNKLNIQAKATHDK